MRKVISYSFICFILSLLQTAFFSDLLGARYTPLLSLALPFALFALGRTNDALVIGFINGLLHDLLGFGLFGVCTLSMVIIFSVLHVVRLQLGTNYLVKMPIFFLISCGYFIGSQINFGTPYFQFPYFVGLATLIATTLFYIIGKTLSHDHYLASRY